MNDVIRKQPFGLQGELWESKMQELLKRDLSKTYLIISSDESICEETYETEMLLKNNLQMFLPLHVLRIDGRSQLFYDVSAKQTLKACAQRVKLNASTIQNLFQSIENLEKEVRDYMLDMESVILNLDHVYTKEGRFYFCYCPWEKKEVMTSFRELLEEILGDLDYHDTKGVELAYHLYQNACRGDLHIREILEEHLEEKESQKEDLLQEYFDNDENEIYLEESMNEEIFSEKTKEKPQKEGILKRIIRFFLKKEDEEEADTEKINQDICYENNASYSFTEVLTPVDSGTVLLQNMPVAKWKLRPLIPGLEEFCVEGDSFLVGKKRDSVDGFIGRDTISRIHSRLFVSENRLFIADANSTNGTFVNGTALQPGEDVEIFPGDRILFADVGYECYNSL